MNYLDIALGFIIGFISSILAGYFIPWWSKKLQSAKNYIYFRIFHSAIDLSGKWRADFREPENDGAILDSSEEILLTQKGSVLVGDGMVAGKYPRRFKYNGQIIHDVFKGTYERIGETRGSIVGTGLFELKVSTDRQTMTGKCIWLDKHTQKIEGSDYTWSKTT